MLEFRMILDLVFGFWVRMWAHEIPTDLTKGGPDMRGLPSSRQSDLGNWSEVVGSTNLDPRGVIALGAHGIGANLYGLK